MASPTLQQVYDAARGWLSDNIVVAGGETYLNAVLQAHYQTAYRELWDSMGITSQNRVRRHWYTNLAAYVSELHPVALGLTDLAEPETLEERGSVTAIAIATTSTASPIEVTTSAPHGLGNNTEVIVSGVSGTPSPLGRWFITVTGLSAFTLNGSVSDGTGGTGGSATFGGDDFTEVHAVDDLDEDRNVGERLGEYTWEEGLIRFRGASTARQLRLTYIASGNPPTNTSLNLGIDNCLNFLGCRTAGLASQARGWYQMADRLNRLALGTAMDPYDPGGLLRQFIHIQVLEMQRTQRRRQPFRRPQFNPNRLIW